MWDVHNGECLRTIILSNSPPLSAGKFTKSSDFILLSSLNSKTSLVDSRSSKVLREYSGYANNEYLIDVDFTRDVRGDIEGFMIGSENGMVHRFSLLQDRPIDSLAVSEEGSTADLLIVRNDHLIVSGRSWSSVQKVSFTPAG